MRRLAIAIAIVLIAGGAAAAWLARELARPYRGYSSAETFVDFPRRTPRWKIADLLEEKGVIRSRVAFALLSEWHRRQVLQAGEYRFDHPMTPREVFAEIAGGHVFVHTVVVPEGWTMFDIANELARQKLCRAADFLKVARDPSLVRDIAPDAPSLEGFLFPATYQFSRNTTPEEMAATMVRHFREEWSKLQASAPDQAGSKSGRDSGEERNLAPAGGAEATLEVVTLASLVERETPLPQERPLVAGVFYNRLRLDVPLQCDPTVEYALDMAGQPTRDVTPEDLRFPSRFNTYLHRGLPPGPIANPGEASLRAALDPAATRYLYFVADASGGHLFSRTLAEHNRNVARLRRLRGIVPASVAPPPAHRTTARKRRPKRKFPRRKMRRPS